MKNLIKIVAQLNIFLGAILIISPMGFLGMYATGFFTPQQVFAENSERETEIITQSPVIDFEIEETTIIESYEVFDVPENTSTDFGNRLIIPSVGIDTVIWENGNGIDALERGVWRMPYHGAPDRNSEPVVLAAHRWGEDNLTWEHRKQHLFLNLPDMKVGDEITITWFGEEYKYRVSHAEVNTEITRLDDLILMTCDSYHSLDRVFIYAEKIEIDN